MEDLSKVLISSSEYYDRNAPYVNFLKRHNFTTVDQIINGKFNCCSFNGFKMKADTTSTLKNFIDLLRHKYLGETLIADAYLDKSIDLESTASFRDRGYVTFTSATKDGYTTENINRFFCGPRGNVAFAEYIELMNARNRQRVAENMPKMDIKLIDFFKWLLEDGNKYSFLSPFARTYVESYESDTKIHKEDIETVKILKTQLGSLLKIRADVDEQISNIQKKLDELSKDDSKGGMRV